MSYENNSIFWVEVDRISPNPYQPRKEFNEGKLRELADSVRMYGILQPLTVTRKEKEHEDGGLSVEYELIAGERRLRAAKIAGLAQVPVIIRMGEDSEREKLELAIIENLQREDLNPVDRALAFRQLEKEFKLSHGEVAKKVGRSRVYVSNTLRLLILPEHILDAMRDQKISEGHGRSLLMLKERPEELETLFRETLLKKLSVRDVERISRKIAVDKVRKKDWGIEPELLELERQLTESLGTRVQIEKKDFGGRLVIDYFAPEDIRKILDMLDQKENHIQNDAAGLAVAAASVQALSDATPLEAAPPLTDTTNETADETSDAAPEVGTEVESDKEIPIDDSVPGDTTDTDTPPENGESDDPDLYSIKNFSL